MTATALALLTAGLALIAALIAGIVAFGAPRRWCAYRGGWCFSPRRCARTLDCLRGEP